MLFLSFTSLFSFHDAPPTQTYTLSLHDALPISPGWNGTGERSCTWLSSEKLSASLWTLTISSRSTKRPRVFRSTTRCRTARRCRSTPARSEERRVGKECRSGWAAHHEKKKET